MKAYLKSRASNDIPNEINGKKQHKMIEHTEKYTNEMIKDMSDRDLISTIWVGRFETINELNMLFDELKNRKLQIFRKHGRAV